MMLAIPVCQTSGNCGFADTTFAKGQSELGLHHRPVAARKTDLIGSLRMRCFEAERFLREHVLAEGAKVPYTDDWRARIFSDSKLSLWKSAREELASRRMQAKSILTTLACSLVSNYAIENDFSNLPLDVLFDNARGPLCFFQGELFRARDHDEL